MLRMMTIDKYDLIFVLFMALSFKKKVLFFNGACLLLRCCVLVLVIIAIESSDPCTRFIVDAVVDFFV
jgi:hypothetical protein